MPFCSNCGQKLILTENFCPNCGQNLKWGGAMASTTSRNITDSNNIQDTHGDVFGIGNIIGRNIVVGDGTIDVSQELSKIPVSEYANALREFSESVNQQLKGTQIPEDKVKEINKSLNELAKEVQGIKPGEEQQIDYLKRTQIESKTATTIQKVLDLLPEVEENTAAIFTPLVPFSKLIGKGVQGIVDAIAKRKK